MFVQELRYETEQTIVVGSLFEKRRRFSDSLTPIVGGQLSWYYWKYLIKSNGVVININNHSWSDIPDCNGCYFLTLTEQDTNKKGNLSLYIHDADFEMPIFLNFLVIDENVFDAKYGNTLLKVETDPLID